MQSCRRGAWCGSARLHAHCKWLANRATRRRTNSQCRAARTTPCPLACLGVGDRKAHELGVVEPNRRILQVLAGAQRHPRQLSRLGAGQLGICAGAQPRAAAARQAGGSQHVGWAARAAERPGDGHRVPGRASISAASLPAFNCMSSRAARWHAPVQHLLEEAVTPGSASSARNSAARSAGALSCTPASAAGSARACHRWPTGQPAIGRAGRGWGFEPWAVQLGELPVLWGGRSPLGASATCSTAARSRSSMLLFWGAQSARIAEQRLFFMPRRRQW